MTEQRGDELELRDTTILARTWWPAAVALIGSMIAGSIGVVSGAWAAFAVTAGLLALAFVASRKPPLAGAPHTRLVVDDDAIRSGEITVVERAEVVEGVLWPDTPWGRFVQLRRRGARPPVEIAVASLEDGRALLEKLRLAPPYAKATFRGQSRGALDVKSIGTVLGTGITLLVVATLKIGRAMTLPDPGFVALLALPLALALVILASRRSQKIIVGADGVLVTSLGRRVFIRYAEVESFTTHERGVRLVLRKGARFEIFAARSERAAIAERLRAAIEHVHVDVGLLAREGRRVGDWIGALRALTKRAEGFRDVPLDADRLWSVLEDPQASASAKVGAAVALSRSLDDAGRVRLRVVSEATVSPKLRVALEAAAQDDDERLRAALEELEEERALP